MHNAPFRSPIGRGATAAALLCLAVAACESGPPTALTLEAAPTIGYFDYGGPPSASGQLGVAGQPITISLEVVDQSGRNVPGVPVSWTVLRDGGSTDVASSITDSTGTAKVNWTLDTIAKLDSLRASLASGSTMLITATGRHAAPVPATIVSGDSQTVAAGATSQPFIVRLTDTYGNPVARVAVAWAVIGGGGTLSAITTATDSAGTTQVTLNTDANLPGVHRVIATYGVVPATVFTINATPATAPQMP